jgi:hypothetical protein
MKEFFPVKKKYEYLNQFDLIFPEVSEEVTMRKTWIFFSTVFLII